MGQLSSDNQVLSGWWKCSNPDCTEPHNMLVVGSAMVLCMLLERMGFSPSDADTSAEGMLIVKNDDSYLTIRPAMSADKMLETMSLG